eukprot:scaffold7641_cov107-Isochrysis_galbana.AAC.1
MLPPSFNGLDGSKEVRVTIPRCQIGHTSKPVAVLTRPEEPAPPILKSTVHDMSSRRGVLNCDQSLIERKLRQPPLPNSMTEGAQPTDD